MWFDLSTPSVITAGINYLPLIFCSLWFANPKAPFILAAIASVLMVSAYFYSPPSNNIDVWIPLTNRTLTLCALWTIAIGMYMNRQGSLARKQSESHLRSVVETVLDGLITIDKKGTIQTFNPASVRIFGYQPEEVIGQNVKMLMPDPYHSEHDGYLSNYMTTGNAKVIGIGREVSARRKDGSVFPIDLGIDEMHVVGERMFVGTIRDISERKEAEQEIQQYVEALKRSNQELDDFAYICSHDLQEPLRMIYNFSERLEKHLGDALDDKGRHYMKYVTGGAAQARQLISDILEYARVDNTVEQLVNIDGKKVLTGVLRDLNTRIEETGAEITYDSLPEVYMQPTHLRQLLQNLIGNALKFCSEKPHVHIGAEQDGMMWRFYVRDNGIGIAPEYMGKIFTIFQRLHSREHYPGTGIGLALCKKLTQKYGGRIWVESEVGKGSTFYFTLPPAADQKSKAA